MSVMSSVTHMNDSEILKNLSRFTPTILDCVKGHLDDLKYAEDTVCVLTHSAAVVFNDTPDPELARLVSLPRIIRFFLSVVRLPTATSLSFGHFCTFCSAATIYHPAVFQSIPDSLDFLVASTRAQDVCTRNAALRSLIGLYPLAGTHPQNITDEPPAVRQALDQFGSHKSYEMRHREQEKKLMQLIDTFAGNPRRSLSDLGLAFVKLILDNELLVRFHFTFPPSERDIRLTSYLGGTQFVDVLRLCGEAVRNSGSGSQADVMGNILQLQFLLACGEMDEAGIVARSCIKRHPSVAFFYYVLASSGDKNIPAVLHGEKGLQCSGLTDFLREELLYNIVLSSDFIVAEMLEGRSSQIHLQEAVALMKKAWSNAISFVNEAPPEHPHMTYMMAFTIHFAFLMRGCTLSDDCRELQTAKNKLFLAYDIARSRPDGLFPVNHCRLETHRLSLPSKDYSSSSIDPNVDLAAWLEKLDPDDPSSNFFELRGINPDTNRYGAAEMHHCSACNTPSAALRRCSGCQKTRYCNSDCQSRYWKVHRNACKPGP
ncbi:hypothetical protein B0H17DRAFT_1298689 [Mycena rosella]|uniref:MYND-type domain-containing protein n=1 Tax=Mycena rosella TaxID=1033263 RepID=A0AAD7M885_MYCRO|nr:hypothetical protein B0H17DRAFT_1298689 [Mycena rosella]